MAFLDLELEPSQFEATQVQADSRSSFERHQNSPADHDKTVGRWRDELSEQQVQAFQAVAGTELEACGYELA